MTTETRQWAIMVPFEDQWLYVMDFENVVDINDVDSYRQLLYGTREAAESVASIWKTYRIVEYAR